MPDSINYGTHAPVEQTIPIDYGSHTQGAQPGFFQSTWDKFKTALPHPIDALNEWASRGAKVGDSMEALHVLNKIAAENPANKGLPPGKQKMLRDPTSEEKAIIERGMNAPLSGPEGNILTDTAAPGYTAAQQARQGDYGGAVGTLAGGYVAPALAGAAIPYVAPAIRTAADFTVPAGKAAARDVGVGLAKAGFGGLIIKTGAIGGAMGEFGGAMLGAPLVKGGVKQIGAGFKAGYKAGMDAVRPPAPPPATDALSRGFTGSTLDPNATITPAVPAPSGAFVSPFDEPVYQRAFSRPAAVPTNTAAAYANGPAPITQPAAPAAVAPQPVSAPPLAAATPAEPAVTAPPVVQTTPPAVEGANAKLSPQEQEWLKKRSADTAAKDEVIAQWMKDKGMTSDQVQPGQAFADLVKQVNKDTGKRYTTRVDDPTHVARVKAVTDLLDSKNAAAASTSTAAALRQAGTSFANASKMTPEQLGLAKDASPKAVADVLFQLKKLELAPAPEAAARP